jgi:hypothetical protein
MSERDIVLHLKSITYVFSPGNRSLADPLPLREVSTLGTHGHIRAHSARNNLTRPFISRTSPVTPCAFFAVTLTSLPDSLVGVLTRWSLCLKSNIKTPFISTQIVGLPCSNNMEPAEIVAALSGALGWEELFLFTPFTRFHDSSLAIFPFLCMRMRILGVRSSRAPAQVSTSA